MTAPAVEIVAPPDAMNDEMVAATSDGLPSSATVRVVESPSTAADVVAQVQWSDGERRHARIVVRTKDGRDTERTLDFGVADPPRERGRALGFAVAAMIPDDLRAPPMPPPEPEPETNAPARAPIVTAVPSQRADHGRNNGSLRSALWLDASAQGGIGFGGSATAVGGALAVRVPFEHMALRIGGAIRGGNVEEASASATLFRADAGVGFYTAVVDPKVTVGGRTGLLVLHHSLVRTESSGIRTADTHTLLGTEALLEGSFAISSRLAFVVATGAEVAFGQTAIVVGETRVAILPPVRLISEAGVRFAF